MKKLIISIVCFLVLVCNVEGATKTEIAPYIGKYVTLHVNMGVWKQETFIGKLLEMYVRVTDNERYYVVTIIKINKDVEDIRIDFIDRIKEINPFTLE